MNPIRIPDPVRVLLVEDSPEVCRRLRSLIEEAQAALVIGEADSTGRALALLCEHKPDAVVLNMNLADGRGCALLVEIKERQPACVVMVLSNFVIPEFRTVCRQLGADHFFDKSQDFEQVPEVLARLGRPHPLPMESHATG